MHSCDPSIALSFENLWVSILGKTVSEYFKTNLQPNLIEKSTEVRERDFASRFFSTFIYLFPGAKIEVNSLDFN
jgi:hypothetical protein